MDAEVIIKQRNGIRLRPDDPDTTKTDILSYRRVFILYHLEDTPQSGHYKAALAVAATCLGFASGWKFRILDDDRSHKLATANDIHDIEHNSYLV